MHKLLVAVTLLTCFSSDSSAEIFALGTRGGPSADGSVVVGWGSSALGREAFRWSAAEGMVGLGLLPGGDRSRAYGVSADGSIIVGTARNADGITVGFVWTSRNRNEVASRHPDSAG